MSEPDFEGKSLEVTIFEGKKILAREIAGKKVFNKTNLREKKRKSTVFQALKSFLANLFGPRNSIFLTLKTSNVKKQKK